MKMRVWGWSADSAGCEAYRIRWIADAINRLHGDEIDYQYGTLMSPEWRENSDVIVGQRVTLSGPSYFWRKWSRQGDRILIYEVDDDLFSVPGHNTRASVIFNVPKNRSRILDNIRASDYVTVSTEPLREAVHRASGFPTDRIVVIPNALPPELVLSEEDAVRRWEQHTHTVGYLASPTHERDFGIVQRHLKRFLERNPGTSFHTIGTDYGERLRLPDRTHHSDWFRSPEDAIRGIDYRMSIAPLEAGYFARSKSDCKFLEASARGAVSVASEVTPYASVRNAETGYTVRRDHEWGKVLQSVYDDPSDALRVMLNANRYVRENRTTDHTVGTWFDVLTRPKPKR